MFDTWFVYGNDLLIAVLFYERRACAEAVLAARHRDRTLASTSFVLVWVLVFATAPVLVVAVIVCVVGGVAVAAVEEVSERWSPHSICNTLSVSPLCREGNRHMGVCVGGDGLQRRRRIRSRKTMQIMTQTDSQTQTDTDADRHTGLGPDVDTET